MKRLILAVTLGVATSCGVPQSTETAPMIDEPTSAILPDLQLTLLGNIAAQASFTATGEDLTSLLIRSPNEDSGRYFELKKQKESYCGAAIYRGAIPEEPTRKVIVIDYSEFDCQFNRPQYTISVTEIDASAEHRSTVRYVGAL
jgi:hypothetical protein